MSEESLVALCSYITAECVAVEPALNFVFKIILRARTLCSLLILLLLTLYLSLHVGENHRSEE
jgi:hypothetical protein